MNHPFWRLDRTTAAVLALLGFAAAFALVQRGSVRGDPQSGLFGGLFASQSLATLAAAALAIGFASIATFLMFASNRVWQSVHEWRGRLHRLETPTQPPNRSAWLLIAAACVLHAVLAGRLAWRNNFPLDDQGDYLLGGVIVREFHNGPLGLPAALYSSDYLEDNRNPLFIFLLSFAPTFAFGKLVSLVFGVILVGVVGYFTAWRFGGRPGVCSAWLLAVNGALLESSSLVACETMLSLLVFFAWRLLADGRTETTGGSWDVGVWLGLAYLTKASAAFLAFLVAGGLLLYRRPAMVQRFAIFTLGFCLVASPLLVRNARRFGNPLHSFNNKLLFAESYEIGVRQPDLGLLGNWRRYRENHSWKEIAVDRFAGGITWESFVLLRMLGPWPMDSGRTVCGAILVAAAAVSWISVVGSRLAGRWTIAWILWFVVFFGWYQPIASGDRFLLPLAAPILVAAAVGFDRVLRASFAGIRLSTLP